MAAPPVAAAQLTSAAGSQTLIRFQGSAVVVQAVCLARCNGAKVELFEQGSVSVEDFRRIVKDSCAAPDRPLIVSYSRKKFQQTGMQAG